MKLYLVAIGHISPQDKPAEIKNLGGLDGAANLRIKHKEEK